MKSRSVLPLLVFLVALASGAVESRELLLDAADVVTIRPSIESQDARLLIRFTMPRDLIDKSVDFACVSFDVSSSGEKGVVSLEAFRVTTPWDAASVSWGEPWTEAGGDWETSVSADWVTPVGEEKTVYFDVTDIVKGWLKEPSRNFGILLKVSEPFTGSFSTNAGQGAPELRILY